MKKVLLFLVMSALLLSALATAQDFSIVIDAEMDEFYKGLTNYEDGLVYLPMACYLLDVGTAPDDDADLSTIFWFAYDETYLYVYGQVMDDVVTAANGTRYLNDCIELKFDPDPASGAGTATANSRLTALGYETAENADGVDNLNGSGHLDDAGGVDYESSEEDYARKLIEGGYVVEFRIPFEYINEPEDNRFMVPIEEGAVFGMAINVGDNDSGSRDHMLQWSAGHTDAAHSNAVELGSVTLLADHKVALVATSPRDPSIINGNMEEWYGNPNPVGIEDNAVVVESYNLSNYPNPFNPTTTIRYKTQRAETASLVIYNVGGDPIRQLSINRFHTPGIHEISWDGRDDSGIMVSSGTYFYQLYTPSTVVSNKMLFLK
ncbi:T9SS type A sorting domain-containing protein [candidate division KSB1 bacterium]|nr:T9SS type A sorting domain-containing protein [candidate division KSB1 bacterium]